MHLDLSNRLLDLLEILSGGLHGRAAEVLLQPVQLRGPWGVREAEALHLPG